MYNSPFAMLPRFAPLSSFSAAAPAMHGTTILCVRRGGRVVMGGDGQVTMGDLVVKGAAVKIRKLARGKVLAGFAGATADAFTLLERFERRLESRQNLSRAAEELSRDWRTDRVLRRLEAMLVVADAREIRVLSGLGDVLEPERDIAAIGSGAGYAEAAARALAEHDAALPARDIVTRAMTIAAELCVYTNHRLTLEELPAENPAPSSTPAPTPAPVADSPAAAPAPGTPAQKN